MKMLLQTAALVAFSAITHFTRMQIPQNPGRQYVTAVITAK
jgi:hypothetical protein